jgi:hypothetical protein
MIFLLTGLPHEMSLWIWVRASLRTQISRKNLDVTVKVCSRNDGGSCPEHVTATLISLNAFVHAYSEKLLI